VLFTADNLCNSVKSTLASANGKQLGRNITGFVAGAHASGTAGIRVQVLKMATLTERFEAQSYRSNGFNRPMTAVLSKQSMFIAVTFNRQ